MSTAVSANHAAIDGLVRAGRQQGMSVDQMRQAGQALIGSIREAQTANPLLAEYFPGLGQWAAAFTGALETALNDLTREVPDEVSQRVDAAYRGITGNDRMGRPIEIGPGLRGELLALVDEGKSDAELRAHVLASQEIGDTRRAIVDGAYQSILGRGPTLAERNETSAFIDRRLGEGATLEQLDRELQTRVWNSPEKSLLEKVGMVFWQQYPEHDAPGLDVKRNWTNWVQSAMSMGMSEDMALMALAQQLRSGSS